MGFGLCIGEPSEPVLRLALTMPYPADNVAFEVGSTSPKSGRRDWLVSGIVLLSVSMWLESLDLPLT